MSPFQQTTRAQALKKGPQTMFLPEPLLLCGELAMASRSKIWEIIKSFSTLVISLMLTEFFRMSFGVLIKI